MGTRRAPAVAEEATKRVFSPEFFAWCPIVDLDAGPEHFVAYSVPVDNAAAHYPATNALVALDHVAAKLIHRYRRRT